MFYSKRGVKIMAGTFEEIRQQLHYTLLCVEEAAKPVLIRKAFGEKLDELYQTYLTLAKGLREEPILSLRYHDVNRRYGKSLR